MSFADMPLAPPDARSADTFPRAKAELIDTGRLRYVFRDFPLDQVVQQAEMRKKHAIDSTPSFVFDGVKSHGVKQAGELNYEAFARLAAAGLAPVQPGWKKMVETGMFLCNFYT